MISRTIWLGFLGLFIAMTVASVPATAQQQQRRPNIFVIMGDDVGWFNVGAYHQGIMSGKTPNLDRLAAKACGSPTTMPKPAAQRVVPTSSPASFLSVQD